MAILLPPTGTHHLLDLISPYVPDGFIHDLCPRQFTGGRRCALSGPQLWRVHLLPLLTSTHSLNLVVAQLPEQAAWRRFCRLRGHWPGVRMLHEFRQQIGVSGLLPDSAAFAGAMALPSRRATARGRADGRDGSTGGLQRLQKKAPARTPLRTRPWAGARSRRGRAAGLSVTRNTPCVCGCLRCIRR